MIDRVLVVCVGNICRSPMAEGLLRARLAARPGLSVGSAGLAALVGAPADPTAQELMRDRGVDLAGHRARQLTQEMVAAHDLVLVMEKEHEWEVLDLAPEARGKVHRLGKFGGFDVPDPYRRPRAAFEEALALIDQGLADFERVILGGPGRGIR